MELHLAHDRLLRIQEKVSVEDLLKSVLAAAAFTPHNTYVWNWQFLASFPSYTVTERQKRPARCVTLSDSCLFLQPYRHSRTLAFPIRMQRAFWMHLATSLFSPPEMFTRLFVFPCSPVQEKTEGVLCTVADKSYIRPASIHIENDIKLCMCFPFICVCVFNVNTSACVSPLLIYTIYALFESHEMK